MIAHADTYRFSVTEFERLVEVGILTESDRIELLDGELIIMAPIGKKHANAVRRLINRFAKLFGDVALVDCQNVMILDEYSAPQPDLLLLKPELDKTGELPHPADVHLVIEVADSSLGFDMTRKLRAYARNGIQEYWVVNLVAFTVDVFRQPSGDAYLEQFRRKGGESIAPLAFPDRSIVVEEILG